MPIEWDIPPIHAASNTADMHRALLSALDRPGRVRVDEGDVDAAIAGADQTVEATYSTPYLPRARMEPGNATVLVTDDRVDIWIGDQSPQETRRSASRITGVPEESVYIHLCHLGGGFGRNGNGPQAEQAVMIANANRGTPIHLLWTREEDFIGTTYRAMGVARLRAGLDADGWPISLEVRTGMQEDGFGPTSSFDVASRYYAPNYRFSNHTTEFHIPCGTRRGVGQAAHEFYRETFMDELARAAGKDPYLYRRELIARTDLPHRDDMIKALDLAAEMSDWGTPLPAGKARAIALEEKGAEASGTATISAMVHTVSVSREGVVRLERVDVALDQGFSLINPSIRQETDRGADYLVLQRRDAPGEHRSRRAHRREQLSSVLRITHQGGSARDQHPVFRDRALDAGYGPRPRYVGSVRNRRRNLSDHGETLSGSAVQPARLELGLRTAAAAAGPSFRRISADSPPCRATSIAVGMYFYGHVHYPQARGHQLLIVIRGLGVVGDQ